jgi:hypothetical protein
MVSLGCFMLPMPLWHPWIFLVLPYVAGLLLAVRCLMRRTPSAETALILYCTMWGCATFAYYLGRSHNLNLIAVAKESVFVAVLLTQRYWQMVRIDKPRFFALPHPYLVLAVALYILPMAVWDIPSLWRDCNQQVYSRLDNTHTPKARALQNIAFIQQHAQPGEEILIFSENNGAYYAETQTRPAMRVLLIDMFRQDQWEEMCRILDSPTPPKIFFEPEGNYRQMDEIKNRLENKTLKIQDQNSFMQLLVPAHTK